MLADKVFLKAQLADGCHHSGFDGLVAHRQYPAAHTKRGCNLSGCVGERSGLSQQLRSAQMCSQIAVAELEPTRRSQHLYALKALKVVAFQAPAAFRAQHARERVSDGIQIRRDVQSPPDEVVTSVHDQCELVG